MTNQSDPLQVAIAAARNAGKIAIDVYRDTRTVTAKGHNDLVTEVDFAAEEAIVTQILAVFPDDAILAEERGKAAGKSPYIWVIDPLDGTHNYAAQLPFWCVSIARCDKETGQPDIAAVYDALHDELYSAQLGRGAWLNEKPIRVSEVANARTSLVACDLGYVERDNERTLSATLLMRPAVRRLRVLGSAVLALAYVASGRLDAFYHTHLMPWDLAAGWLLVTEAGGAATTWAGAPLSLYQTEVLVSNSVLHPGLVELLSQGA